MSYTTKFNKVRFCSTLGYYGKNSNYFTIGWFIVFGVKGTVFNKSLIKEYFSVHRSENR